MPVVYDGTNGVGQGDLFKDLKLWLSHRIPMREKWVNLVQNNGGHVVPLEKNAGMLIADHVRRAGVGPPPGSYSYRWIEFSVKNGALENKDDYLIGRPEGSSRNVGAAEQTKSGRTPFTREDDLILTKWVLVKESLGINHTSGNSIYKDLEKKYPHHTWQSWRERWLRILRYRPRLHIPDEELRELQAAEARAAGTAAVAQATSSPLRQQQQVARDMGGTSEERPRIGRKFFTQEEDQMLIDHIREHKAAKLGGNKIYQEFAEKHPSHSWHSWRDRWVRHLSLRQTLDDERPGARNTVAPPGASGHGDQQLRSMASDSLKLAALALATNNEAQLHGTADATSLVARPSVPPHPPNPKSDDERLKRQRQAREAANAATRLQGLGERDQAQLEAAFVPLQSLMRGYLLRMKQADRLAEVMAAANEDGLVDITKEGRQDAGLASGGMTHPEDPARLQFHSDLRDYLEINGSTVNMEPLIMGWRIDLWDLFRVATQQECQPEDRDWQQVADDLGFDAETNPSIASKIRDCWEDNLADFEEAIRAFEYQDDGIEEGEEEGEEEEPPEEESLPDEAAEVLLTPNAMTAPYQPLAELSSPAYRSSPPLVGLKRSRQPSELLTSDLAYPSSPSQKRRRLDKNTVIPPTPEEKLMTSRGQLRRRTPQDGSSPFKSQAFTEDEIVEVSSAEDSDGLLDEEIQAGEEADQLPTNNISRRGVDNPVTRGSPVGTGHEQSDHDPIQEDEASPARFAPRRWIGSTGKQNGNIVSPTGQNRVMRADNNTPNLNSKYTANLVVPDTVTSRAPVNGHAKKRTLPPQYQRHTISDQNNTVQPVPQTNFSALGRPSGFPPTRTADKTMPPSGLSGGYTPGIARQAQPTFSASAPSQISSGHKATGIPEKSNFELHALNAQFYHFQALGYSEDHIVRAQNASTCQRGPMIVALDSLAHGRGIPENEPGVWSQRDIDDLDMIRAYERRQEKGQERAGRGDNGREKVSVWQAQHRLESKHGKKMIEYRNQFLDIMNRTG